MSDKSNIGDHIGARVIRANGQVEDQGDFVSSAMLQVRYDFVCLGKDGKEKWRDHFYNLLPDASLTDMLNVWLNSGSANAQQYIGLTNTTPAPAPGNTMDPGTRSWTENTDYAAGTRPAWTKTAAANKVITNPTSVDFSINASTVVGGAFLSSDSTKGGTTGLLYSVKAFVGGDKNLSNGDTLQVTISITASSS